MSDIRRTVHIAGTTHMSDRETWEIAIKAEALVKEALILADSTDFSLVAIHLNQALVAIEQEKVLSSQYSS